MTTGWQQIRLWLSRAMLGLLSLLLAIYAIDWALWRLKEAHGAGYATIQVMRFQVASLKGNREEYYPDGTMEERCSRSLLPQGGSRACWWVDRHRVVMER